MKLTKQSWMLAAILTCSLFFVSCYREDNPIDESQQNEIVFQAELDQAMMWAQVYGPPTQSLAEEVAARHNGKTTPLNYKTRTGRLALQRHPYRDWFGARTLTLLL